MPADQNRPQPEPTAVPPESGERRREIEREVDTVAQERHLLAQAALVRGSESEPIAGSEAAAQSTAATSAAVIATLRPGAPVGDHSSTPSLAAISAARIHDANNRLGLDAFETQATNSIRHTSSEAPPSHQLPEPGQYVGRYLTEEVLGRGGMGLVLRARDDLLQRTVAIKVILPQYLAADPAAGLRFLREAEIVARLQHPHIIRVLDAGLDRGVAFLAFEYIEGSTFSSLRERGPLEPSAAVDLMLPVISAVASAHRHGVVHGDLKPSNLILATDYSGRPHPWVLDFGVSFFSEVEAGLDPMRRKITGTPGYMAPEWLDQRVVDGRADCFSLGCVVYELIAGKGPFAGSTRLSEAAAAALARSYPALHEVSSASLELSERVHRALAPTPAERYPSAKALGRALLPFACAELQMHYAREFKE